MLTTTTSHGLFACRPFNDFTFPPEFDILSKKEKKRREEIAVKCYRWTEWRTWRAWLFFSCGLVFLFLRYSPIPFNRDSGFLFLQSRRKMSPFPFTRLVVRCHSHYSRKWREWEEKPTTRRCYCQTFWRWPEYREGLSWKKKPFSKRKEKSGSDFWKLDEEKWPFLCSAWKLFGRLRRLTVLFYFFLSFPLNSFLPSSVFLEMSSGRGSFRSTRRLPLPLLSVTALISVADLLPGIHLKKKHINRHPTSPPSQIPCVGFS